MKMLVFPRKGCATAQWNPTCNKFPHWGRGNDLQSELLDPLVGLGRHGAAVDAGNAGVHYRA
jgi:hypothetical protein